MFGDFAVLPFILASSPGVFKGNRVFYPRDMSGVFKENKAIHPCGASHTSCACSVPLACLYCGLVAVSN